MPLILHGKQISPQCQAVMVTAKAIGIDVQLQDVDMISQANKSEMYSKMNPSHTIPTLDDDGFYLWESRPIMSYLVDKYAKDDQLYPKDLKQRAVVDQMIHFDVGSLASTIGQYFYPQLFVGETAVHEKETAMRQKLKTLDTIVGRRRFAAADHVTIADIAILTSLSIPRAFGFSYDEYPNVGRYIVDVKRELPVYEQVTDDGESQLARLVQAKMKIK